MSICKSCQGRKKNVFFLSNDVDLLEKAVPIKSLYHSNDGTGIHVSVKGAEILEDDIQTFFDSGGTSDDRYETPSTYKRNRSVLSITPPSDKQRLKTVKK